MTEGHNQLLFIETVGCQMNVLDSELVVAALRADGYRLTDQVGDADTVLFTRAVSVSMPSTRSTASWVV
jgi:tRNA-2-methylthio-N6-dimethylallyladenosine synthase